MLFQFHLGISFSIYLLVYFLRLHISEAIWRKQSCYPVVDAQVLPSVQFFSLDSSALETDHKTFFLCKDNEE
jgi:prepilin signal peptidase PulO-like enzyme (type II secretory pathway)